MEKSSTDADPPAPGRRTQGERSATMRTRILSSAIAILNEKGYSGATVKAIAKAAGVSVGSLQYQFTSKAGLMAAVIRQLLLVRLTGYRTLTRDRPARRGVDELTWLSWEAARNPEFMATIEVALARRSDDELRRETDRSFQLVERVIERTMVSTWQDDAVDPDVTGICRRINSAFMTGLALRMSSGLEPGAADLVPHWTRILESFVESAGAIGSADRTTAIRRRDGIG